jgi:16S rRNA (uracil1498-N3)-methyltransferase
MADRFYTTDALGTGEYTLTGPEAHHLATVRRFNSGDRITLFNGDGAEYPAEIIAVSKKSAVVQITSVLTPHRELEFPLIVASALPKGDRADFLIEKLTELGVTRFIPLLTDRAIVRPKPAVVEKFNRAVIEASKQCGRNRLMATDQPCCWNELLNRPDLPAHRYVLHTESPTGIQPVARTAAIAAIGPEGGFTPEEVTRATNDGWQSLTLGPRTLRIETAAISAAILLGR